MRNGAQSLHRALRLGHRLLARIVERTAVSDRVEHRLEFLEPALLDGRSYNGGLLRIAPAHGIDQWQGRLAFGEIVAQVLAGLPMIARIVEHVIDQLESSAE